MFFHLALLVAACVFSFTPVVNTMAISVEKQAVRKAGGREKEKRKERGYRGDGKARAHG